MIEKNTLKLLCFCVCVRFCVCGWCVEEFSAGSNPQVQSVELGSMWEKIKRLSGTFPFSPASPLYRTHWTSWHAHLLPLMYVCADWFLWGKVTRNRCTGGVQTRTSSGVQRVLRSVSAGPVCLLPNDNVIRHPVNSVGGSAVSLSVTFLSAITVTQSMQPCHLYPFMYSFNESSHSFPFSRTMKKSADFKIVNGNIYFVPRFIATHLVNQSQSKLSRDEDQRDNEWKLPGHNVPVIK